ncbi:MAG TPA: MarR family transcriptional regulator [Candidatus Merdenecus merdavium]|nr:MarR family transcriptional regulator [Candidatus Merdenecus merdavium]
MKEHLTNVRLKILFSILHIKQSKQNATSIAQGLHISKSTVSRAIEKFQEQGIVDEYQLKLTEEGEEIVKYYWKCKEYIKEWLKIDHQILESTAEDEAIALVLNTRKETLDSIMKEINDKKKRHIMGELDGFTHQCIDYLLEDGTYQVAFTIYKSKIKNGLIVSMANDGFIHPASLVIKNGIGMVSLTSKKYGTHCPSTKVYYLVP